MFVAEDFFTFDVSNEMSENKSTACTMAYVSIKTLELTGSCR